MHFSNDLLVWIAFCIAAKIQQDPEYRRQGSWILFRINQKTMHSRQSVDNFSSTKVSDNM